MELKEKIEIARNKLYDKLPSGNIDGFELIKIIKEHIEDLDTIIDETPNSETSHNNDFKKPCPNCNGTGVGKSKDNIGTECNYCNGQGFMKS